MIRVLNNQLNQGIQFPRAYPLPGTPNNKARESLLKDPTRAGLEFFVKRTICDPLEIGQIISIQRDDREIDRYTVYRKIANEGLVSYALVPENTDLPSLIVFRCTEPDLTKEESLASLQNDLDVQIGQRGWDASQADFENLMQDPNFTRDKKIKVAGYSLGGAQAQLFLAKYHENVAHAITYSSPHVSADVADQFARDLRDSSRTQPLVLEIIRTYGDPCTSAGDKHLGCGIERSSKIVIRLLEAVVDGNQNIAFEHHRKLVFGQETRDFTFKEIIGPNFLKYELDNAQRGGVIETARSILGPIAREALTFVRATANNVVAPLANAILSPAPASIRA